MFVIRKRLFLIFTSAFICILLIALGLGFGLGYKKSSSNEKVEITIMEDGKFLKAAVSTDSADCAPIGLEVLKHGGTAVDSAIATLFCNGIYSSQSMGIGGGFFMTIYLKEPRKAYALDARETAPSMATKDMFHGDPEKSSYGGLSVAIPGEIKGYYSAKQRFGNPNITWASLLEPSIKMAEEGITVSWTLDAALTTYSNKLYEDPTLRSIFFNPKTNSTWKKGEKFKNLALAETFKRIAANGSDEFYQGQTAKMFVEDLQKLGGIITLEDMKNYEVVYHEPISADIDKNFVLYTVGPPASGIIVAFILNILKHFNFKPGLEDSLFHHRVAEAFKWAYGKRSLLGDPYDSEISKEVLQLVSNLTSDFLAQSVYSKVNDSQTIDDPFFYGGDFWIPDDHGTSHTSILAQNGDAVSVTSTINLAFGAKIASPSTGIIFNNEMDDFSSPNIINGFGINPSPTNFIKPGKRPLSSMSPIIIVDRCSGNVRLVTGGSGGTRITTATAQVSLKNIWMGKSIKESIEDKRIHHQLLPMRVDYEDGLDPVIIDGLKFRGHVVEKSEGKSVVQGISLENDGFIHAFADSRKAGATAGF